MLLFQIPTNVRTHYNNQHVRLKGGEVIRPRPYIDITDFGIDEKKQELKKFLTCK